MEYPDHERAILMASLRQRVKAYYDKVGNDGYRAWQKACINQITAGCPSLEDPDKYQLYHLLTGAGDKSFDLQKQPYFDFEGEFSIQKMIENLEV
jgi:hypothetical protein